MKGGFEVLGQGDELREVRPNPLVIAVDAEAGGELSGEQGRAAGSTHWSRDVGIGEEAALLGKCVDVGSVDVSGIVIVHAANPGAHVINGEGEDVGFFLCRYREDRWQSEGQAGEQC